LSWQFAVSHVKNNPANCPLPTDDRAIGKCKRNCAGFPYKKEEIKNNFQAPFMPQK